MKALAYSLILIVLFSLQPLRASEKHPLPVKSKSAVSATIEVPAGTVVQVATTVPISSKTGVCHAGNHGKNGSLTFLFD